jgi:hypothetical protein
MASLPVRLMQGGHLQSYALIFTAGIAVMFLYYVTR